MFNKYNILINGILIPACDNEIEILFNLIDQKVETTAIGNIATITTTNARPSFSLYWSRMSINDMKKLCKACKIDIPEAGQPYKILTIKERVMKMTIILPVGIRTIEVYIGSTLKATLSTLGCIEFDNDFEMIDGIYEKYFNWKDITLDVIGIGSKTTVNS